MNVNDRNTNLVSLLASSSTLICCALPAIFVLLGAGASFVTLINIFPFLVTVSQYKTYITVFAFTIILFAGIVNYKTYRMPCPIDPELKKICLTTRKRSRFIYYISVTIFIFSTTFTYFIPRII